ncbi:hypothetical protein SAMN05421736_116115 [Evansella caseinilytica]|uniref:Sporulation membrane protein YtrI C-terminal domain-containing protein n=1 Tax=Evansella caseinilytica TaxID=1503961 RepID=A0A1H3TX90_9BACI|nr:sporulation membrane protein YtrI [Evansella caseinilytica]SDZ54678.1 hypothetical protein SAMN05421736_116115 [Evansella caseinilytica]
MRIPPLYQDKSWQRFFAGFIIGMLIGWLFFLYHFGMVHEKLIMEIKEQQTTITNQEDRIENLTKEQDQKNEEMKKSLTVQEITITFTNEKEVKLSELTLQELRGSIEGELELIRNKNIETVASSKELLLKSVENKVFIIGDKKYRLIIEQLILFTELEMYLRIESAE